MKHYDLIVAGGGFSGVAAAVTAREMGMKNVLLVELGNCLGGAASQNLVIPFMPFWYVSGEGKTMLSAGLFSRITERMRAMTRYPLQEPIRRFDTEELKLVLEDLALEAGVELLYHTMLTDARAENGRIRSVTLSNISGNTECTADYFVDATGNGDLAVRAGFPYQLGRQEDHLCQPMTLCFRISNIDVDRFVALKPQINAKYQELQAAGKIKNPRENVLVFRACNKNVLHMNTTRVVKRDPTDAFDVTKAEIEARRQVWELMEFLRSNFEELRDIELLMTAPAIGVRESRMIRGEYVLTGKEIMQCARFEDSIALCNYDLDIHSPDGTGTSHHYFAPGEYYQIPYRVLTPEKSANLLVCGRCVSADHEAQASLRIMPVVCCLGEAAGAAAALAAQAQSGVREISVKALQDALRSRGAEL